MTILLRHLPTLLLLLMLGLLPGLCRATDAAAREHSFRLFNAMLYKDMPAFGEKQVVVYEQSFFRAGTMPDGIRPSARGIAQAVGNAEIQQRDPTRRQLSPFIALDLERWHLWPFVSQTEHATSIGHYADTARRFARQSKQPICLYSVFPFGGINATSQAVRNKEMRASLLQANQESARQLKGVVSALCPQLYNYYRFGGANGNTLALEQWKVFATETIKLARQLAPDLPVYPFIWPQYHQGGNVSGYEFVEADIWRAQLQHLTKLADGAIVWGGYDFAASKPLTWDNDASWWQVLQQELPAQTRIGANNKP